MKLGLRPLARAIDCALPQLIALALISLALVALCVVAGLTARLADRINATPSLPEPRAAWMP